MPNKKQRDDLILKIVKYLISQDPVISGAHRKNQWEEGWEENLNEYLKTRELYSIIPKYFDKYKVQRLGGDFIIPESDNFEVRLVSIFQYIIFEKFFKKATHVYEFGAGTGHNLLRLREVNKSASLYSMEWTNSGIEIIKHVAVDMNDNKLYGTVFDNFNPNYDIKLQKNSFIYTFAALEQLGSSTDKLIAYWMSNNPSLIVNIEPMSEPLDDNELLQYLSIKYFKKRRYLEGYVTKLRDLERKGMVVIHDIIRTGVGSLYIEGYSVVAWSPVCSASPSI